MTKREELFNLLAPYYRVPLDCDGQSNVFRRVLKDNGIKHKLMVGKVKSIETGQVFPYHEWIEIGKWIIDFKARKWLGDHASYGVFKRTKSNIEFFEVEDKSDRQIYSWEVLEVLLK